MDVFWCLFALASPKQRYLPKCKSANARSAAYDLLVEMVMGSVQNYAVLHEKVMTQHCRGTSLVGLESPITSRGRGQ